MKNEKHILIAVSGMAPQVITESLYALRIQKVPAIPISEIILITTYQGKKVAADFLLNKRNGFFYRFCSDYKINPRSIKFPASNILAPKNLPDIRTTEENEIFGEFIFSLIREKTDIPNTMLHCSIAGGRKTMSVYMAYALSLCGRKDDKLYHVLINPSDIEHSDFAYPLPNQAQNKTKIEIDFAEVPYVRLREKLQTIFGKSDFNYRAMVHRSQAFIQQLQEPEKLFVNKRKQEVYIGSSKIHLRDFDFFVYRFFAENRLHTPKNIPIDDYESVFESGGKRFSQNSAEIIRKMYDPERTAIRWEEIQQSLSRIKAAILKIIPDEDYRQLYIVNRVGTKFHGKYGIKLDPSRIVIK